MNAAINIKGILTLFKQTENSPTQGQHYIIQTRQI